MKITRQSKLTGVIRSREIDVTPEQLEQLALPNRTAPIQYICPDLSPSDREFLMTGITDEEWKSIGWADEEDA
jgi:hypothetical protein